MSLIRSFSHLESSTITAEEFLEEIVRAIQQTGREIAMRTKFQSADGQDLWLLIHPLLIDSIESDLMASGQPVSPAKPEVH